MVHMAQEVLDEAVDEVAVMLGGNLEPPHMDVRSFLRALDAGQRYLTRMVRAGQVEQVEYAIRLQAASAVWALACLRHKLATGPVEWARPAKVVLPVAKAVRKRVKRQA